ncbi:MAG: hypothetical protein ACREQY_15445 [Candidatus Binatia bacterium]
MKRFVIAVVLLALPAMARAQTPEVCTFDGTALIPSGIGAAPQQNVPFSFSGVLGDPGGSCGAPGNVNASGEIVVGGCPGNVHQGTANTPLGGVDFAGVCAGALCVGVSYNQDPAGFVYVLAFDQATIENALAQCPTDDFKKAVFSGAAVGGSAM